MEKQKRKYVKPRPLLQFNQRFLKNRPWEKAHGRLIFCYSSSFFLASSMIFA